MKKQIEIYHSFLTIRLPTARTSDEAKRIIQGEFIRPLTSILKDEFGSIMLGAYGVYAIKPNRHVHLILISEGVKKIV